MHEFEALPLSNTTNIDILLKTKKNKEWSANILKNFGNNPKKINNSYSTATFKRTQTHMNIENKTYSKIINIINTLKELTLAKISEKYKYFNDWVTRLEQLGKLKKSGE